MNKTKFDDTMFKELEEIQKDRDNLSNVNKALGDYGLKLEQENSALKDKLGKNVMEIIMEYDNIIAKYEQRWKKLKAYFFVDKCDMNNWRKMEEIEKEKT